MLPSENLMITERNQQATEMDKDWLAGMIDGDGNITLRVYKRKNNLDSVVKRVRVGTISETALNKLIECFRSYGVNPYVFTRSGTPPFYEVNVHKHSHLIKCLDDLSVRSLAKSSQLYELNRYILDPSSLLESSQRITDLNRVGIERGINFFPSLVPSAGWMAGIIDSDGYMSSGVCGVVNTDWRIIRYAKLFAESIGASCYVKERAVRRGWVKRKDLLFTKKRDINLLYDSVKDYLVIKSI